MSNAEGLRIQTGYQYTYTQLDSDYSVGRLPVSDTKIDVVMGASAKSSKTQELGSGKEKESEGSRKIAYGGQDVVGAQNFGGGRILSCLAVADGVSLVSGTKPEDSMRVAEVFVRTALDYGRKVAFSPQIPPQSGDRADNLITQTLAQSISEACNTVRNIGLRGASTGLVATISEEQVGNQKKKILNYAGVGDSQIMVSYYDPQRKEQVLQKLFHAQSHKEVEPNGRRVERLESAIDSSGRYQIQAGTLDLSRYSEMSDLKVILASDFLGEKVSDERIKRMFQKDRNSMGSIVLRSVENQKPSWLNVISRTVGASLRRKNPIQENIIRELAELDRDDGSVIVASIPK